MQHDNSLHAFYDLSVSPLSFDFICFLVEAERHRRVFNLDRLSIVVVPENEQLNQGPRHHNSQNKKWRLANLLTPSCWLLPSCKNLSVCEDRNHAEAIETNLATHIFPKNYSVQEPVAHHHTGLPVLASHQGYNLQYLKSSPQARSYVRQWLDRHTDGKRAITLTLREAAFTPKRNSDFQVWAGIAQRLKEKGFCPIIVRDTDTALNPETTELEGIDQFPVAAFNLEMRMALYEESHMCAFVSNGPSTPCYYSRDVKYVYFVTGEWLDKNDPTFHRVGIEWGSTPPFANEFQRWVWKEQDVGSYVQEIVSLDEHICASFVENEPTTLLDPMFANKRNGYDFALTIQSWCRGQGDDVRPEIALALEALKTLSQKDIKTLSQEDISEAEILNLQGNFHQMAGNHAAVVNCYTHAAEITKKESDFLKLALIKDLGINQTEMILYYESLLTRFPDFKKIADLLNEKKAAKEQLFANNLTTIAEAATKFSASHDADEASSIIQINYGSLETSHACLLMATIYTNQDRNDAAAKYYEQALSSGYDSEVTKYLLGICYLNMGRAFKAIDILETIDLETIKSAKITLALGEIHTRVGNNLKALEVYKNAELGGYANDEILKCLSKFDEPIYD